MILEDKILAYLDGSLGESESAELLHTLSVSPEQRALLEEHLRLKDMLTAGQKPMAIPAYVERSLAARIPILAEGMRQTAIPLVRTGFVAASLSAVRSFFMAHAVSTAVLLGSIVTGVAILGVHELSSNSNPQVVSTSLSHVAVARNLTSATSSFAAGSLADVTHSTSDDVSSASVGTSNVANEYRTSPHRIAFGNREVTQGSIGSSVLHNLSGTSEEAGTTVANAHPITDGNSIAPSASDRSFSDASIRPLAITPPDREPAHSLKDLREVKDERSHRVSLGASYNLYSYQLPHPVGSPSTSSIMALPEASLMYEVSPEFKIGLEGGSTLYSLVNQGANSNPLTGFAARSYSRVVYQSEVQTFQTQWARVTAQLILNPADQFPIYMSAGGGLAFESRTEPIAALALGLMHTLTSNVILDAAIVGSGVWGAPGVSTAGYADQSPSSVIGIVHPAFSNQSTFTPAIGLRAGIRFQP